MHSDRSILSKLLLSLVHLSQEIDESIATFRHTLFRPVGELELTDSPRSSVARVRYLYEDIEQIVMIML